MTLVFQIPYPIVAVTEILYRKNLYDLFLYDYEFANLTELYIKDFNYRPRRDVAPPTPESRLVEKIGPFFDIYPRTYYLDFEESNGTTTMAIEVNRLSNYNLLIQFFNEKLDAVRIDEFNYPFSMEINHNHQ